MSQLIQTALKEYWRPVAGYQYYEISNQGRLRRDGRILKPGDRRGYSYYVLSNNNIKKTHSAHRLVGFAFIDNPLNKPCINHKDANRKNNNVENLEWCTQSENHQHAIARGVHNFNRKEVAVYSMQNQPMMRFKSITDMAIFFDAKRPTVSKYVDTNRIYRKNYLLKTCLDSAENQKTS